jgi:hypothetical protein
VYFTSFFFNNRKQSGPACSPISATLGARLGHAAGDEDRGVPVGWGEGVMG